MNICATVYFENINGPDEGHAWTNRLSFLSEDHAKKAAKALADAGVTDIAIVIVWDNDRGEEKVAQIEYTSGNELVVFDHRMPSLFHGKL